MKLPNWFGQRLGMLMVAFALVFFVSACDDNEANEVDEAAVVVDGEADVVEDAEVDVDAEADAEIATDAEVDTDDVDAVETTVMTDTIIDTDVITEVEVITQVEAAEIEVETTVMTDTDVTIDRASDTESEVTVETEDVDTSSSTAIVVMTDSAGGTFLGDPVEQRPYFVSEQDEMIVDENFEAIEFDEEIIYDEGIDQNMFGEFDNDGIRQLTYGDRTLYRYTGPEDGDWRAAAEELGLRQLTPEGEIGDMAE